MRKLSLYTGDKTFMFPSGKIATPEVMAEKYPAITKFKHVVETDDNYEVVMSISNLSLLRTRYGIDASLSDEEAIASIETKLNEKPVALTGTTAPTPEERIAAALEYQNLLTMEDAE